jgi:pyrroloquinoline quinone biosynthesis protein E
VTRAPHNLVAELTYRCPLRCAYCSNPTHGPVGPELDAVAWAALLAEAEALGVVHVSLTGGEPLVRDDLEAIVAEASRLDLYTHLVTSGLPLERARLARLREAGLAAMQLSLQDTDAAGATRVAGRHALCEKRRAARWARELGLPLTVNVVLHRENLPRLPALLAEAEALEPDKIELANTAYLGWAGQNRDGLLVGDGRGAGGGSI